jgi:hypothetical protein
VLIVTLVASKGIANVPAGALVALATVLVTLNLPVGAIAIIWDQLSGQHGGGAARGENGRRR